MSKDKEFIQSRAHDWAQTLPLSDSAVVCTRCGMRAPIREMSEAPRCTPHFESATSGYKEEL